MGQRGRVPLTGCCLSKASTAKTECCRKTTLDRADNTGRSPAAALTRSSQAAWLHSCGERQIRRPTGIVLALGRSKRLVWLLSLSLLPERFMQPSEHLELAAFVSMHAERLIAQRADPGTAAQSLLDRVEGPLGSLDARAEKVRVRGIGRPPSARLAAREGGDSADPHQRRANARVDRRGSGQRRPAVRVRSRAGGAERARGPCQGPLPGACSSCCIRRASRPTKRCG